MHPGSPIALFMGGIAASVMLASAVMSVGGSNERLKTLSWTLLGASLFAAFWGDQFWIGAAVGLVGANWTLRSRSALVVTIAFLAVLGAVVVYAQLYGVSWLLAP